MKKTMFITSVIMVVVMAIALTTSSLAWFSAAGNDSVSTSTLKLEAQASTPTGIFIRHDSSDTWHDSISLGTTIQGLYPMVPLIKANSATEALLTTALVGGTEVPYLTKKELADDHVKYTDSSEANTTATYARIYAAATDTYLTEDGGYAIANYYTVSEGVYTFETDFEAYYNALLAANLISNQNVGSTAAAGTEYDAYMIGNVIDANSDYGDGLYRGIDNSGDTDKYFVDTLEIKNGAEGYGAKDIKLGVEISFSFNVQTRDNGIWNFGEKQVYSRTNRGEAQFDNDATLCVAILAKTNENNDSNRATYQNTKNADNDGWEIIGYADSKHWSYFDSTTQQYKFNNGTATSPNSTYNVVVGKNGTDFVEGAASGSSTTTLSTATLNKLTSDQLQPLREWTITDGTELKAGDAVGDGVVLPADIKTIKVVAWYSADLNSNNSEWANLSFDLKFTRSEVNNKVVND